MGRKKGYKHSNETKKKISDKLSENPPQLGKKFSDEHKKNLSESHKGYKMPKKQKIKIGLAVKENYKKHEQTNT